MIRMPIILTLAVFVILIIAAGADILGDPHAVDLGNRLAHYSWSNPLGTDHLGRDVLTRVVLGAVPSLMAIGLVLAGGIGVGIVAGGMIALGPAVLRQAISWMAETVLSLPTLVTALVLSAMIGPGVWTVALALLVTSWAPYALTIAALFDRIRGETYWQATEAMGASLPRAMCRHMLPNAWPAIAALAGADAGRAVVLVASLGFIGLSADTGQPEWGAMIYEYRTFIFTEPRLVLAPVIACAMVSLLLHLALDTRVHDPQPT